MEQELVDQELLEYQVHHQFFQQLQVQVEVEEQFFVLLQVFNLEDLVEEVVEQHQEEQEIVHQ